MAEIKPWIVQRQDDGSMDLLCPEGWWKAYVRFDGCVEITRAFNSPFGTEKHRSHFTDRIHLCDLDDFIARLQEVQVEARGHFGEHWE